MSMKESTYFCRVDVAKDSFVISVKNGEFLMKRTFIMDKIGFGFEQTVREFRANVVIGRKPTGIYHQNLFNFLKNKGYNSSC